MKGARGLLISITGGKDLTLFEVDEAATRIREEVDQDANIIVGATFDESLDGIIRVSVVATGIEQALIRNTTTPGATLASAVAPAAAPDSRLADLTAKLRADNARMAERAAQKLETPSPAQAAPAVAPQPRASNSVERAALAAIAAAVAPETPQPAPMQPASYGDVTVRPIAQKPTLFPDHEVARVETPEAPTPETFIPQAAERPPVRAPRMPKFEDLPMPRRRDPAGPWRNRGGASAKDPDVAAAAPCQCRPRPPRRRDRAADRGPCLGTGNVVDAAAAGAQAAALGGSTNRRQRSGIGIRRRPAPQGLDVHGRPAPVAATPQGDDHLDIPAFCGARRTEVCYNSDDRKAPAVAAGALFFCPATELGWPIKQLILND